MVLVPEVLQVDELFEEFVGGGGGGCWVGAEVGAGSANNCRLIFLFIILLSLFSFLSCNATKSFFIYY